MPVKRRASRQPLMNSRRGPRHLTCNCPKKHIQKMKRSRGSEEDTRLSRGADDDTSFSDHDLATVPPSKIVDLELNDQNTPIESTMKCSMPGHKEGLTFNSYEEYAAHYNSAHTNRCLECHKNLPSSLLLNVHIEDCHDSFIAAKREKGEKTVR